MAKRAKRRPKRTRERLSRSSWVRAGIVLLTEAGIEGVKVEPLARRLGVSKGSFYWHFGDRADLLGAMLELWEAETEQLIERANEACTPLERLRRLYQSIEALALEEPGVEHVRDSPDLAIFRWAQADPEVAACVRRVEGRRLEYLRELFTELGFEDCEAQRRADIAYAAFLGFLERLSRSPELLEDFAGFNDAVIRMLTDDPA